MEDEQHGLIPTIEPRIDSCGREWVAYVPDQALFLTANPLGTFHSSLVDLLSEPDELEMALSLTVEREDNLYLAYIVGRSGTIRISKRPCIQYADASLWEYPAGP